MTPPLLYACYFGTGNQKQWPRMASVLAFTAAQHCPGWTIQLERIAEPPTARSASDGERANTSKLDRWFDVIAAQPDGARVLLIDVDTAILRPLDPVWDRAFDVAYTVRPTASKFPLNAGVVFVRTGPRALAFMRAWRDENRRMRTDPQRHTEWRRRYAGMNQAALGCLLESPDRPDADLLTLPCREWNCEDSTWQFFDADVTRILHLKSQLRLALFHGVVGRPYLRPLVKRWRALEQRMTEPPARTA